MNRIKPKIQVLNEESIKTIHSESLKIIQKTGIRVESQTAINIFRRSESVEVKGELVYIHEDLIENAILTSPSNIRIYNKKGEFAFNLGSDQQDETHFGIGVTNPNFQEINNGEVIPFTRQHTRNICKMGDFLDNYSMVSTPGIPANIEKGKLDLLSSLDMYATSDKPLVLLFSEEDSIERVFDLLTYLNGDISEKPFLLGYVNPITPLVLNKTTSDKMIACISANLPLMFSNYSMYGGTSPISPFGTLTLLNAELLAGLVFSQLIREGSKVILGSLPAAFNMTTMGSSFTTSTYLLNLACAEMMNHYNIPHCGTSGSSNGWGPDLKASADLWINHLTSCMGKVGCAPFVGGNFDSLALSPSNIVLSDHIIGEARKFANGFEIDNTSFNFDEIAEAGPGGNFFTSESTLRSVSEMQNQKEIWSQETLESWLSKGKPKAEQLLIDHTLDLYNRASKETEQNMDVILKGEKYIKSKFSF